MANRPSNAAQHRRPVCVAGADHDRRRHFVETHVRDAQHAHLLDAAGVYSLFFAYKTYAETAGLLRAAFAKSAELSDKYTFFCLTRSYKETQKWFQKIFEQSEWLEKAKKVAPQADPTAASLGAAVERLTQDAKQSASGT